MSKKNAFIKKWMDRLSPEPRVAGLAIGTDEIRYVYAGEKGEEKYSIRLAEGTIDQGGVVKPDELQKALEALHDMVLPKKKEGMIKVVASLPPGAAYTQSLKIPYVGKSQLEESVRLNLEIVTPIRAEDALMGWQKIKEFDNEIEILGAFMEKAKMESVRTPLEHAKFYPVAFEFPALSIMRMIKIKEKQGICALAYISNDGMNFFITKEGALYFDYFISWKEIQGEQKEITGEIFEEALEKEMRRVSNFALGKAGQGLDRVLYIAEGLESRVEAIIRDKLGFKTEKAEVEGVSAGSVWYVAEGAGRRMDESEESREINVGAGGLKQAFFEERIMRFIRLWRNIGIGVLVVFLVVDGIGATVLGKASQDISAKVAAFQAKKEGKELLALEAEVKKFNAMVASISKEKEGTRDWAAFLLNVNQMARSKNIRITRIEVDAKNGAVSMSAEGTDHASVIEFKNILEKEPKLESVDLPLSKIAVVDGNNVTFSLSFKIKK